MTDMGIPYAGAPEKNRLVLSALGTFKTSCLVPSTMEAAPRTTEKASTSSLLPGSRIFIPVISSPGARILIFQYMMPVL